MATLRGEKYSSDLAGEQYSVGRGVLAGMLMVASLGIPLLRWKCDELRWGQEDFAEDDPSVAIG